MSCLEAKSINEALPNIQEAMKRYWLYCRENADKEYLKFSLPISYPNEKMVGVRVPLIRAVSKPIKKQDKKVIKQFIDELWPSKIFEDRILASFLAECINEWPFVAKMSKTADSWGLVDELCCHSLGPLLLEEPQRFSQLKKWAKSKNKWQRRVATVTLISWMKSDKPKKKALEVLDLLMLDEEHIIKKATDWMLREWAKKDNEPAFNYMMKWAKKGNKHTKNVLTAASWKLTPARKKKLRDAL